MIGFSEVQSLELWLWVLGVRSRVHKSQFGLKGLGLRL